MARNGRDLPGNDARLARQLRRFVSMGEPLANLYWGLRMMKRRLITFITCLKPDLP